MDYDDILALIGDLGPYQKRLLVLTLILIVYNPFGLSVSNFILGNQLYRCKIPWLPNDTYAIQNSVHESVINKTIPLDKDGDYETYHIIQNGTMEKCCDWVFDYSFFTRTANSQFKLVCDDELMVNHATLIHYVGALLACVIVTPITDLLKLSSDLTWITIALTMIGKMLISLVYGIIYIYTGELFPTVVRGVIFGACIFSAGNGSLITPYLYELGEGKFETTLPLILYASTTIIAAALSCFLPETTDKHLQEKVKDADTSPEKEKEKEKEEEIKNLYSIGL